MFRYIAFLFFSIPLFCQAQQWTLDSCISYAFQKNLSILQSEQSVRLAEVNELTATGGFLPTLNAQASHGYNWGQRIDPFTNQFASSRIQSNNLGIATSLNLFNGFQQVNTYKQAQLNVDVSKWNYEKMRNDIALSVASAYLNVLVTKEFMDIAQRTLDATDRQVKRMEKLVTAGQMSPGNLNEIMAQQASDNASLVAATNNYELAKIGLMQHLQLDAGQSSTFSIIVPELEDVESLELISNPEVAVEMAINNFPDIKGATVNLASADLGRKIANAGYYPSLNASFTFGTGYSGAARVLTGNPDTLSFPIGTVLGSGELVTSFPQLSFAGDDYSVKPFSDQLSDNVNRSLFFTLNVPLFNGFATRSSVKRAEINQVNARLQLEQTKQTIEQNVYRAYTDAKASLANYYANKSSVDANQKAFDWAELRYEQGVSNLVDFADARTRLENAQAALTRSKYDYIFKVKVLEFYMGKTINLK
jgi:outer membrane protein